MGGVDQANQLRASFTTHFSRNRKEFFPEIFFIIYIAVVNSYKLNLALNRSKTTSINISLFIYILILLILTLFLDKRDSR